MFKVGDKVIVRPWAAMAEQFGTTSSGAIRFSASFIQDMKMYCGKTMTISGIKDSECVTLKECEAGYYFHKNALDLVERAEPKQKTVKEWFETLPTPYREHAILCSISCYKSLDSRLNANVESLARAIDRGIDWRDTPQGYDFWSEVHDWARDQSKALPELPKAANFAEMKKGLEDLKGRLQKARLHLFE